MSGIRVAGGKALGAVQTQRITPGKQTMAKLIEAEAEIERLRKELFQNRDRMYPGAKTMSEIERLRAEVARLRAERDDWRKRAFAAMPSAE